MLQGQSTSEHGAQAVAPARATRIAQRGDWSPRARGVLVAVRDLSSRALSPLLASALTQFEHDLSTQAGEARSSEQRRHCFETLRQVQRARSEAGQRFMAQIEEGLARFDQRRSGDGIGPRDGAELALVATADLEESLGLQETATRVEARHPQALHDLGHRFAVLAGQPAFDLATVPLGPARITAALRAACDGLSIPTDHRVLFYRAFDRVAASAMGGFFDALNALFVEHRILRNLRVHAPVRKKGGGSTEGTAAENASATEEPAAAAGAAVPMMPFAAMRELLAGRRSALGLSRPGDAHGGHVVSVEDLQAALARLKSPTPPAQPATGRHSSEHLQKQLLEQLRGTAPAGGDPKLQAEDSDTIDLVGMLLDQVAVSAPAHGTTQSLLSNLQAPLLRVALRDKAFFSEQGHPARLLLNAITEAGIHWIDTSEGAADPALLRRMHQVVERLNNEFDGSLSLIERMLADLTQHVHALTRKAEVSERRIVDATKGREKLALARETAADAIGARIGASRPGRLLRTMLEQAWTDVLALTILRHGADSDAYRSRLAVVDQLIEAGSPRGRAQPVDSALRRDVESGLAQVGYHPDEIRAVVGHLLTPDQVQGDDAQDSRTAVAIRLKSKGHLGETTEENRPRRAAVERRAALKLDAEEERILERLKTLPFGTWFEIAVNQQGDRVRRKLSWYSTVTGRCVFVNVRGVRVAERSIEQLARDVVAGQAAIVEPEQRSLVDRAWSAIMASLRQIAARGAAPRWPQG